VRSFTIEPGALSRPDAGPDTFRGGLVNVLRAADRLRPGTTDRLWGKRIVCHLEFPPDWGLGSSSTLIDFLATYLEIDPYALLAGSFGGSGYDLACAGAGGGLLYRRTDSGPKVTALDWRPDWLRHTHFVHLNRKQNSRDGIAAYRRAKPSPTDLVAIDRLTLSLTDPAPHLRAAALILDRHEALVADVLGIPRIRETFPDFPGTVKSLGAWGGDFIWALSEEPAEKVRAYFNGRGYGTFIPYHDMAL
jgi:hypothetical protein